MVKLVFYSEIGKSKLFGCVWRESELTFILLKICIYRFIKTVICSITAPTFKEFITAIEVIISDPLFVTVVELVIMMN